MTTQHLMVSLAALALGLSGLSLSAADKAAKPLPGYTVLLELKVDANGTVEEAQVITSDDASLDHLLDKTAMGNAQVMKLPPRMKDGKAVPYTVRVPFSFPVEGDEGPTPANVIKPRITQAQQPVYPADLAEKGEVGGVILEAVIGVNGTVTNLKVLRSSRPEFAQAAIAAVERWSFIPAHKDGALVESRWSLSLCFETDVRTTDWQWRVAPRPSLGNYTVIHRTLPAEAPAGEPPAKK
jgi:TonB family protein